MYFAVIGDIIRSREIGKSRRNDVQIRLKEVLEEINQEYYESTASKFIITIGDEFQGLLVNPEKLITIIDTIRFRMHPVKIRFGLGAGEMDTDINKEMSLGADGPAYHYARNMIDRLKSLQRGKMTGNPDIMIYGGNDGNDQLLDLVNSNLQLCSFIESKWTDKQRELIQMIYIEDKNQLEAAARLKVAQSSVQRRLKSAGYYDFIHARELLTSSFQYLWGDAK